MGNLTVATMFIVIANVLMMLSTIAMHDVNSSIPIGSFCYHPEGTPIEGSYHGLDYDYNQTIYSNSPSDIQALLPNASTSSIQAGTANINFIDVFNKVATWVKAGGSVLLTVATGPYSMLRCTGLPSIFSALIGAAWTAITIIFLVAFMAGRND